MLVILEGESLLNDASALLVYRLAVTATVSGALTTPQIALTLLVVFPGSLAAGWLLARIYLICVRPLSDIPSSIVVQFVSTFGVWLFAEDIGLSSILTVVQSRSWPVVNSPHVRPEHDRYAELASSLHHPSSWMPWAL